MLKLNRDQIGGLIFLFVSLLYGYFARDIDLMPGDEHQAFNAQTLPSALSTMGIIFSSMLIVASSIRKDAYLSIRCSAFNFSTIFKLLLLIVVFAISLKWIGFLVATVFFLVAGFWILGERNTKKMLTIAVLFSVITWFILHHLLDVYLAPGRLFSVLFGV